MYEELKYDWFCYIAMSYVFVHMASDPIYLAYCDLPWFVIVWKLVLYPVQGKNWRFFIWPPQIVSIVGGSYWSIRHILRLMRSYAIICLMQFHVIRVCNVQYISWNMCTVYCDSYLEEILSAFFRFPWHIDQYAAWFLLSPMSFHPL